jgi:16S rRNA (guanine966-N2)-methyltransferase
MRILSGSLKGHGLKTIVAPGCRPAMGKVRAALFSALEARGMVWTGARVLDLFAGTGSVGFEALSRGAGTACFVEAEKKIAACLAHNARKLGLTESVDIVEQKVERFLRGPARPFDVIFIDPPYGQGYLEPTLSQVSRGGWLRPGGWLAAEAETGLRTPVLETLLPIMDRSYGQTRILLWTTRDDSPSIREPLIP